MDQSPVKHTEQYPLLQSDGGGDGNKRPQHATVPPQTWSVTCVPKQTWYTRWPEFLSACWITAVLIVISFFVFYALGMSVYRRHPVVILQCNESKPAGNVYFHQIVSEDGGIPFKRYSNYISYMAVKYPSLRFQIYFLVDDSGQKTKNTAILRRLIPHISRTFNSIIDQNYMREFRDFQRRYQNVNISVLHLSKYMDVIPLRFCWSRVPRKYLPFFARVYEVWRHGGIALDLLTYHNRFNVQNRIPPKLDMILKQHNDGIDLEKYGEILDSLGNKEENIELNMVFDIFNNLFYHIGDFFYSNVTDFNLLTDNRPIRTHRTKRFSVIEESNNNETDVEEIPEIPILNTNNKTVDNLTSIIGADEAHVATNTSMMRRDVMNRTVDLYNKTTYFDQILDDVSDGVMKMCNKMNDTASSYWPQYYFTYDISKFFDDIPSLIWTPAKSERKIHNRFISKKMFNDNYLTMNSDGSFIAATAPNHKFLMRIISGMCLQVIPEIAISNTYMRHCSKILFRDINCDSVHISHSL